MNTNKVNFSKIAEIAAGVAAILIALGGGIGALIKPIKSFADDWTTVSKVFNIILSLEKVLLFIPVIVLGVALILRWVSQGKLKLVTIIASAASALIFIVYQATDFIYSFALEKDAYGKMSHPVRDLFIVLLYAVAAIVFAFVVYDSQNHLIKKNSKNITFIVTYAGVGVVMFLAISLVTRAGAFIFPLLLIVSVLSRRELDTKFASLFGFGGIAAALLFSFFNAFIEPINLLVKNTTIFSTLLNYNDAFVVISLALIPLVFLSRSFEDQSKIG